MTNPACWHLLTSLLAEVFGGLWVLCLQLGTPVVLQNWTTKYSNRNSRNYGSRIWHDEDIQSFVHTLDIRNSHGTTRYHYLMITHQQARKIGSPHLGQAPQQRIQRVRLGASFPFTAAVLSWSWEIHEFVLVDVRDYPMDVSFLLVVSMLWIMKELELQNVPRHESKKQTVDLQWFPKTTGRRLSLSY